MCSSVLGGYVSKRVSVLLLHCLQGAELGTQKQKSHHWSLPRVALNLAIELKFIGIHPKVKHRLQDEGPGLAGMMMTDDCQKPQISGNVCHIAVA